MAKEVTNTELSRMIKKGFDGTDVRFKSLESSMATKDQVEQLRTEVREIRDVMLADHLKRIERLEQAFQAAHPHR